MIPVIKKLSRFLFTSIISSIVLLMLGWVIHYFFQKDPQSALTDTLFWVGAIPVVIFTIGQFGNFFVRGDTAYQQSRSVDKRSLNKKANQDEKDTMLRLTSGLNWITAGLLVWLYSYFI